MRHSRQLNGFHFKALACDGDGTLLTGKTLAKRTATALVRWRRTGHATLLTTGETVEQLRKFPRLDLFDLVVAENGAVLYWPTLNRRRKLAASPPAAFVRMLRRQEIPKLTVGDSIVSVSRACAGQVQDAIDAFGLDWRISFNRDEAMALPSKVDKAWGLEHALGELRLSCDELVAVGDAENDLPLVGACGLGVAVASAVRDLKKHADMTVKHGSGAGVVELIRMLMEREKHRS